MSRILTPMKVIGGVVHEMQNQPEKNRQLFSL